jgi:oxygen-independent coproporphyrinogen-3 oxidase
MIAIDTQLLKKHDRPGPRYTSYPPATSFHEGFTEVDYRERLARADAKDAPLSVYMHLPFCRARCLYCACNVVITPRVDVADAYLDRLVREVELVAEQLPNRRQVAQFHWGGGTPTYHDTPQLRRLMARFRDHFELVPDAEVAVEVDPRVTTDAHLETLAEIGFNRLSMGVQDFDPAVQETVNRIQSYEETLHLSELGRRLGMTSVNIDLIYGLPGQSVTGFSETMERIVELSPDRVAVYSFAFVPWMKGHQKRIDQATMPSVETKYELLLTARRALLDAGYVAIGMDHYAKPDDELSEAQREGRLHRNFMGYTTIKAPDMLGFGISSIGYVSHAFAQNEKKLSRYYRAIDAGRLPILKGYALSRDDRIRADVIRELMCNFIVHKGEIEARYDIDFDTYFAEDYGRLAPLVQADFLSNDPDALRVGPMGQIFIRNVAMCFDAHLAQLSGDQPRFSRTV